MTDVLNADALSRATKFLAQYGVKGMRWGVRRSEKQLARSRASSETEVTLKYKPGGKVKTSGGANRPPSEDFKKAAAAGQIARTSGSSALSNSELQAFVQRANLESQYSKILASQNLKNKSAAQKFLEDVALQIGKKQATTLGNKAIEEAIKKASKKGD